MDLIIFAATAAGIFFILSVKKYPQMKKRSRDRRLEEEYFRRMSRR